MPHIRYVFSVLLATMPLGAQATWTQLAPATSPTPRAGTWGVSDATGVVMFGGLAGGGLWLDETWRFDGASWTNLAPAIAPSPRDFYAAAWDSLRGRLVLFGGRDATTEYGDTWEFDGAQWVQLAPAAAPSARRWAAMAYDSQRAETILFGGNTTAGTTAGYVDETWRWDGTTWTQLAPATTPGARARGFLSYDFTRGEMLYFGGRNAAALGDTWIWNGTDWRQVVTANAPGSGGVAGLFAYGITYDFARDRHVVFGGTRTGGTLAGTWEFDGADWTQRAAGGPASRTGCTLQYVLGLGKSILFGGFQSTQLGDTWEYQTAAFPTTQPIGNGCAGSGGTPILSPSTEPWLGDAYTVTATNLGAASLPFHLLGFSDTSFAGGPLPAPLALLHPAGGVGCDLLVSPDSVSLLGNVGGSASFTVALPNDPGFAGYTLFQQVLQVEFGPGFTIAAIGSTNALRLVLGSR